VRTRRLMTGNSPRDDAHAVCYMCAQQLIFARASLGQGELMVCTRLVKVRVSAARLLGSVMWEAFNRHRDTLTSLFLNSRY